MGRAPRQALYGSRGHPQGDEQETHTTSPPTMPVGAAGPRLVTPPPSTSPCQPQALGVALYTCYFTWRTLLMWVGPGHQRGDPPVARLAPARAQEKSNHVTNRNTQPSPKIVLGLDLPTPTMRMAGLESSPLKIHGEQLDLGGEKWERNERGHRSNASRHHWAPSWAGGGRGWTSGGGCFEGYPVQY